MRVGSDKSCESNCLEMRSASQEPEIGEEIVVRMIDELIDEAKEAASNHRLVTQGEGNGGAQQEHGSSVHAESDFVLIRCDASLSTRRQVNLIQQGRQEREVRQRRDMNDFLDRLDQEIDDATPVGTKNKYRPIQDDFEVTSFIIINFGQADIGNRFFALQPVVMGMVSS